MPLATLEVSEFTNFLDFWYGKDAAFSYWDFTSPFTQATGRAVRGACPSQGQAPDEGIRKKSSESLIIIKNQEPKL